RHRRTAPARRIALVILRRGDRHFCCRVSCGLLSRRGRPDGAGHSNARSRGGEQVAAIEAWFGSGVGCDALRQVIGHFILPEARVGTALCNIVWSLELRRLLINDGHVILKYNMWTTNSRCQRRPYRL